MATLTVSRDLAQPPSQATAARRPPSIRSSSGATPFRSRRLWSDTAEQSSPRLSDVHSLSAQRELQMSKNTRPFYLKEPADRPGGMSCLPVALEYHGRLHHVIWHKQGETPTRSLIPIIADTLRRDHLGCYGNDWISTPPLGCLRCPICRFRAGLRGILTTVPHRYDVFTGRYKFTESRWGLRPRNEVVLSGELAKVGYISVMILDQPHIMEKGFHHDRGFTGWEWIRGQETDRWQTAPSSLTLVCDPQKLRAAIGPADSKCCGFRPQVRSLRKSCGLGKMKGLRWAQTY